MVAKKQKRKNCTYRRARREGNRIKHARRRLPYASGRCTNNNINQICLKDSIISLYSLAYFPSNPLHLHFIDSLRKRQAGIWQTRRYPRAIYRWMVCGKKRERESLLLFRSIEFSGLLSYYDNREILSMEKWLENTVVYLANIFRIPCNPTRNFPRRITILQSPSLFACCRGIIFFRAYRDTKLNA